MKSKIATLISAVLIFLSAALTITYLLFWLSYLFPSLITSDSKLQPSHLAITRYILWDSNSKLQTILDSDQAKHIEDVGGVVQKIPLVTLFSVLALVLLKKRFKVDLNRAAVKALYITILFIIVSVFFFMPFFIKFHELLFPQGNWQFPSDSVLISLYPEKLWLTFTVILFVLTLAVLLITQTVIKRKVTNT